MDEEDDEEPEEEDEDEDEEEEDDGDEAEDGDEDEDGDKGEGGSDGSDPSVLTQESEKRATKQSTPAKRTTQRAAGAPAEAEVPLSHTASQPTLAAHGHVWAASCCSALALKRARKDQAKTWQEARKQGNKQGSKQGSKARKPAPP